jgi:hypothetical protein
VEYHDLESQHDYRHATLMWTRDKRLCEAARLSEFTRRWRERSPDVMRADFAS